VALSVIIPFTALPGADGEHRQRVWDYLRPRWEALGHELITPADPGPGDWSYARAFRVGVEQSTGDVIMCYGADHLPDPDVLDATVSLLETHQWVATYADVAYATEAATAALLAGQITEDQLTWSHYSGRCIGMWGFTRAAWEETGGADPRFVGWGYGDDAFTDVLTAAYGPSPEPPGPVLRELWHPDTERDPSAANPNHVLYFTEYAPYRGDRDAMLAMKEKWT
jgi:hypothetical protein